MTPKSDGFKPICAMIIDAGNDVARGDATTTREYDLCVSELKEIAKAASHSCTARNMLFYGLKTDAFVDAISPDHDGWRSYFAKKEHLTSFKKVHLNALMVTTSKVAIIGCYLDSDSWAKASKRYTLDNLFVPAVATAFPIIPLPVIHSVGASINSDVEQDHDDAMAELFAADPNLAADTLNAILEDGDQGELLITLGQIAKAKGLAGIAEQANVNRSQLYRTLSEHGNPSLNTLIAILTAMGLRLSVQPIETKEAA